MNETNTTIFDPRTSEELFSKRRLVLSDKIEIGGRSWPIEAVCERLHGHMTPARLETLRRVVEHRSFHVVSVLENIYDRGNISAVMRSADAFGFLRMHLIDQPGARFKAANRVTRGAEKWLDVQPHVAPADAVRDLRQQGYQIWATDLDTNHSIDSLDWSKPLAFV